MDFPSQAPAHGPALIRLLERIGGAGAPAPSHSLSDRLAQWVEWRQAVALSAALAARPAAPASPESDPTAGDDEYARARTTLVGTIEGDRAFAAPPASADDSFYRQRYTFMQQVMDAEVRHLRGRLRARLTRHSAALGRLAAVDAAMEQALAPRERALLAPLPELLGRYFERLRQAASDAAPASPTPSTAWQDAFRHDMQRLLLAELDLRLQPSQGLIAALRSHTSGFHGQ